MLLEHKGDPAPAPEPAVGRHLRGDPGARRRCSCGVALRALVVAGAVVALVGLALVLFYRSAFLAVLVGRLPLRPDSEALPLFERPPSEAAAAFYLFNVTNADAVAIYGEKPRLAQLGPYTYRLHDTKRQLEFSPDLAQLSYARHKLYVFDRERSAGDEDDTVVTLDLVAYSGFQTAHAKNQTRFGGALLDSMQRGQPFRAFRVGDLLWGAHDSLYQVLLAVAPGGGGKEPVFGLMRGKNDSADANLTVATGAGDVAAIQQVRRLNGAARLADVWPRVERLAVDPWAAPGQAYDANAVGGTLGQTFHPDVGRDDALQVFSYDVCLALSLKWRRDTDTLGLPTLRFGIDHDAHRRLTGALNAALCGDGANDERCARPGLINATRCRGGLPLVMSWPHFLETDAYYLALVEGLAPAEEAHGVFLDVDPLTGRTLRGAKRVQLNWPLVPLPYEHYKNLPPFTLLPIMWLEEAAQVSPAGMAVLRRLVFDKFALLRLGAYAVFAAGLVLLAASLVVFVAYHLNCPDRL